MNNGESNSKPLENLIERAVRVLRDDEVPPGPPEELVASTVRAISMLPAPAKAAEAEKRRKRIMRYVRYNSAIAAAVMLLIGGVALTLIHSVPAVGLADVIGAARKHKLAGYKRKLTHTSPEGRTATNAWTVYVDLKVSRFREEASPWRFQDLDDPTKMIEQVGVTVTDYANERILMTNSHPGSSGGKLAPRKDAWLGSLPKSNKYKPFLEILAALQEKKGVTSAKDTLDGRETVRFRQEEEIDTATHTNTFWIDVKSKLPVRMTNELAYKDGSTDRFDSTNFEWDPPLPNGFRSLDELFSTRPPEGYELKDETKKHQ
jgi:hypothetical protein